MVPGEPGTGSDPEPGQPAPAAAGTRRDPDGRQLITGTSPGRRSKRPLAGAFLLYRQIVPGKPRRPYRGRGSRSAGAIRTGGSDPDRGNRAQQSGRAAAIRTGATVRSDPEPGRQLVPGEPAAIREAAAADTRRDPEQRHPQTGRNGSCRGFPAGRGILPGKPRRPHRGRCSDPEGATVRSCRHPAAIRNQAPAPGAAGTRFRW